jgi:hypothetical protein
MALAIQRTMASVARYPRPVAARSHFGAWLSGRDTGELRRLRALDADPDATTWPSYKRRKKMALIKIASFVLGLTMGIAGAFGPEIDAWFAEGRMWIAHELRAMKSHPSDEDLALPRPHRMVARAARKQRQSYPSVMAVPVLEVTDLPVASLTP